MIKGLLRNPGALTVSVLAHVFIIVIAVVQFNSTTPGVKKTDKQAVKTIQVKAVDAAALEQAWAEQRQQQQKKRQAVADKQKKAIAEKRRIEKEKAKEKSREKAEEKRRKVVADKAAKKIAEQLAEKKRKAEAEMKKKAEIETKLKLAEAKKKAEAEAKAAKERRRQEELKQQLAAEERSNELQDMLTQWKTAIGQKVRRNWLKPSGSEKAATCEIIVEQLPGGLVADVRFGQCDWGRSYRRSVELAVYKAEPLPSAPDPKIFDRIIAFTFDQGK
ncbi:MAG: cell envelope integrity protein TolA [Gammaproteobacteria bacterium]|nr:cell envelope integrity protein TolA [Gammaproteobacteria bacterium]